MGHVKAQIHTDKLSGPIGKGLTVLTNDPKRPELALTLRAEVLTSVTFFPGELVRLSNAQGAQPIAWLLVRQHRSEQGELAVANVTSTIPWLRLRAEPKPEAGPSGVVGLPPVRKGDWLFEVSAGDDPVWGRSRGTLSFDTGLPRQPRVEVPLAIDLTPPVQLSKERLELTSSAPGEAPGADFVLSVRVDLDPSQLRVETTPETLRVALEPAGARAFKARATWSAGAGEPGEGQILLAVGSERVRLPVTRGGS